MHDYLRHLILGWWARQICAHPIAVLVIAGLPATVSVVLALTMLGFQSDRNDLISTELDWNQLYIQYINEFSGDDLMVVVQIPSTPGGRKQAESFVLDLGRRLDAADDLVAVAYYGFALDQMPGQAVRLESDWQQFENTIEQVEDAGLLVTSGSLSQLINSIGQQMRQSATAMDARQAVAEIHRLTDLFHAMTGAIAATQPGEAQRRFAQGVGEPVSDRQFLVSDDGKLLLILIEPVGPAGELEVRTPQIVRLRQMIRSVRADHPEIEAGLTGVPVIEADETTVVTQDSTLASIVAFSIIAVLLVVAFHGWQKPLLALVSLLIGIAWTFGYLTLAIGHLQVLSVVFTVILLGLGVDFGIHMITHFELLRQDHSDDLAGFQATLVEVFQDTGPGILTGAVTTAVAFATTVFTDFKGMAEMGQIAGVGILLCMLAMLTVFPALLRLTRVHCRHVKPLSQRKVSFYEPHWWGGLCQKPRLTVVLTLLVSLIVGAGIGFVRFDYNLVKLLPTGVPSVHWQNVLMAHTSDSIWFGASVVPPKADGSVDLAEARRRVHAFRKLDAIGNVRGIGMLFAPDESRKIQRIRQAREKIGLGPTTRPAESDSPEQLEDAMARLAMMSSLALGSGQLKDHPALAEAMTELNTAIAQCRSALSQLPEAIARQRVDQLTAIYRELQKRMLEVVSEQQLTLSDLPDVIKHKNLGGADRNKLLIQVFPASDVYDPVNLERFVRQLRQVDPKVSGTVMQVYESNRLITRSYLLAGIYALVAVYLLVLLDFHHFVDALLTLVPVTLAFVVIMGLMGWCSLLFPDSVIFTLNLANIIVLPLLFGIGVDAGVHMIHRWRQDPTDYPCGLGGGTGKGITLTSLTTAIGFATMMLAHHRGIMSLGFLLAFGIMLVLLSCLTVMPAVLSIRTALSRRLSAAGHESDEHRPGDGEPS